VSVGAGAQESASLKSSPGDSCKINLMPLLPETQKNKVATSKRAVTAICGNGEMPGARECQDASLPVSCHSTNNMDMF